MIGGMAKPPRHALAMEQLVGANDASTIPRQMTVKSIRTLQFNIRAFLLSKWLVDTCHTGTEIVMAHDEGEENGWLVLMLRRAAQLRTTRDTTRGAATGTVQIATTFHPSIRRKGSRNFKNRWWDA